MFRGAIILGIGYGLGYAHALRTSPDVVNAFLDLSDSLKRAMEETTITVEKTEHKSDAVDSTAVDTPLGEH